MSGDTGLAAAAESGDVVNDDAINSAYVDTLNLWVCVTLCDVRCHKT